jgi:hypothetical protein
VNICVLDNDNAGADFWLLGYGKLQLALPAPTVVDVHVSEYGAVILNRDEAKVAGFFVLYLDAELILVSVDELHFARPLVCQWGYGMLARLDVGADARLFHLVIDDNLAGIAIQRHALSKLIFGRNDNLFATRELDRALGCTTVRVELAYGML